MLSIMLDKVKHAFQYFPIVPLRQLPENTNCLTCTADGRFLGLAHTQGLSVWCASSFTPAAEWLQPQLELIFIQMTRMAEMTYLLGTVDDMGRMPQTCH